MATFGIRLLLLSMALCATWVAHALISAPEPGAARAQVSKLGPGSAKPLGFGFETIVADYRWLEAVQLVGYEHADLIAAAPAIQQLVGSVVALDPYVGHPYRFASLWLVNDVEQVRAANKILERGIAYHPTDWRNRFYLSFNYFFYLGDAAAATRELEAAVNLEGAPRYLGPLLARLRSGTNGLEAAGAYLDELLKQTEDPWKIAEYQKALDEIETERRARYLDQARLVYRDRNGRDIEKVDDLAAGRDAVLPKLPPELHGWGWVLDPADGQIVSSYYNRRYLLNMHDIDRQRVVKWTGHDPLAGAKGETQ